MIIRIINSYALVVFFALIAISCSPRYTDKTLPSSRGLGNPRGFSVARVITHTHSPYSHDACDNNGIQNGVLNEECLNNLRYALCSNRIDFAFITDHPNHMQDYEIKDLILQRGSDEAIMDNGKFYVNKMAGCETGVIPQISVGFEGKLLALGMKQHLDSSMSVRSELYDSDSLDIRNRLKNEADALVFIPHTEGKSLDWIKSLQPDGIEAYNFHANVDPKIRHRDLNLPPFEAITAFLSYLIDPYKELNPDFSFLHVLKVSPVYSNKWSSLISSGFRVTGIGGSDSHENVFAQKVSDGERLDSHRRILRLMSNHVLVNNYDIQEVKSALKLGRSWIVFEGLGTPSQMDFYATTEGTTVGVGEAGTLKPSGASIIVKCPSLHPDSVQDRTIRPIIKISLKKIIAGGGDQIVATSEGQDLHYTTLETGAYRAELSIIPKHIKSYLADFQALADQEYPWIITNHLYLDP